MNLPSFRIESPRLVIRTYRLSDAKALFRLVQANRARLADYFPATVAAHTSAMASRAYLLERLADRKAGRYLFAGIFHKETGQLIGQLLLRDINWQVPKCDAGYFIDGAHAGQGLGAEAMTLFAEHCFRALRMVKISLRIEPANTASKRMAEKCGFTCIGVAKNDFRSSEGRLMDCEVWEKCADG